MKKRYFIGFFMLTIGVLIGFVNIISHLKSIDVVISNSITKMGGGIVFAQMDNSVLAVSLKSGHINAFDFDGNFLYASRVSTGLKDDLTVNYKDGLAYISYEHISDKFFVFSVDGYLGETTYCPKTKYTAENDLELKDVEFKSKSFGRVFINFGKKEKQLTNISFWNWYWNDIGIICILPISGIVLLLPWMIDLLSKQTHNSRIFYKMKHNKF